MSNFSYPRYEPSKGYMTEQIQFQYINAQAAMWIDVLGGGHAYHCGEFRLSFHHSHNAMQLMNDKGAQRWVKLMVETLNDPTVYKPVNPA